MMLAGLYSEANTLAALLSILGVKAIFSIVSNKECKSNSISSTRLSCMMVRQDALADLSCQGYPERLCAKDQFL